MEKIINADLRKLRKNTLKITQVHQTNIFYDDDSGYPNSEYILYQIRISEEYSIYKVKYTKVDDDHEYIEDHSNSYFETYADALIFIKLKEIDLKSDALTHIEDEYIFDKDELNKDSTKFGEKLDLQSKHLNNINDLLSNNDIAVVESWSTVDKTFDSTKNNMLSKQKTMIESKFWKKEFDLKKEISELKEKIKEG